MDKLLQEISKCILCAAHLPLGPRPVITAHPTSKIIIIGQAPGTVVHKTGIPWNDKSGDRLRDWMGIDKELFYDTTKFAIIPMGFCYPGRGKSGDLPPRKECAPTWHDLLLKELKEVELILLIGKYAQDYYLKGIGQRTLSENVRNFHLYLPQFFVLPHPSPRNNIWLKKNDWFPKEVLPSLKMKIRELV